MGQTYHSNEFDADYDSDNVTCKYCSTDGLYWVHTGERWRLMEGRNFHHCPPSADDFNVLT